MEHRFRQWFYLLRAMTPQPHQVYKQTPFLCKSRQPPRAGWLSFDIYPVPAGALTFQKPLRFLRICLIITSASVDLPPSGRRLYFKSARMGHCWDRVSLRGRQILAGLDLIPGQVISRNLDLRRVAGRFAACQMKVKPTNSQVKPTNFLVKPTNKKQAGRFRPACKRARLKERAQRNCACITLQPNRRDGPHSRTQ